MAEEVTQYFRSYRHTGWNAPVETVPQEMESQPEVQPAGWVINSSANVFIDADGLHVNDGAIFLSDMYGESVLTPSGFAGVWSDFLAFGFYNGSFNQNIAATGLTAVTEVSGAHTIEDYENSLSANLTHWVIEARSGAGSTYQTPAGSAFFVNPSSGAVASTFSIYQDVPIGGGMEYSIRVLLNWDNGTDLRVFAEPLDADHASILGASLIGTLALTGSGNDESFTTFFEQADELAKFLRITLTVRLPATNLANAQIKQVEITRKSYTPWETPTLLNSWVEYNPSFSAPAYYKDPWGVVHLRGVIANGSAVDATMFTLPAGFRPADAAIFTGACSAGPCRINVTSGGNVSQAASVGGWNSATGWVSIDGITFKAEA